MLLPNRSAVVDSNLPGLKKNPDGGATGWFGPKASTGNTKRIGYRLGPVRGYNVTLRFSIAPWHFELQL
jgi:hypothetical protein